MAAATLAAAAAAQREREDNGFSVQLDQEGSIETNSETRSNPPEEIYELPAENSPRETPAQQSEESSN